MLFASEGAQVVIAELDTERGVASVVDVQSIPSTEALFIETDVTRETSITQAMQQAATQYGKIDILVNCAGGSLAADASVTEVDMSV